MMGNRSGLQLLIIMRDNIHLIGAFGLCSLVDTLWRQNTISQNEMLVLEDFLNSNLPDNKCSRNTYYCWPRGAQAPRLKWLNKQIKMF